MPVINVTYRQLSNIIRAIEHQIDRMIQLDTTASKLTAQKLGTLRTMLRKAPRPNNQEAILQIARDERKTRKEIRDDLHSLLKNESTYMKRKPITSTSNPEQQPPQKET